MHRVPAVGTRSLLTRLAVAVAVLGTGFSIQAAEGPNGERIYKQQCAWCHGAKGEGSKRYKMPLIGDRTVPQLAVLIDKTMPEDDPDKCTAEDAKAVAAYIYDAFYSPTAQTRNKPPRIELSRLTVEQYRNAVADLIGSFRPPPQRGPGQGLKGEYFSARRFPNNKRVLERVDAEVRFDWGTESPVPGKIEPHEFSIRWQGSVTAPETGEYEFVVRTEHATKLWINDPIRPLIDATVKSGSDTEYRGSTTLIRGRSYFVKLELSRATQGVQDPKLNKPKPGPASILLGWKPPHGIVEPIPARWLSPNWSPEGFAVNTPFPPDDRSLGWERGTTVSKAWDAAVTDAALETADYVSAQLNALAGTRDAAPDREAKLRAFATKFTERAFRRPLTEVQKRLYVDRQFEIAKDPALAVKRVVLLTLKSPRFLYRELNGRSDSFDVAERLAFMLWNSLPDDELLKAAASGKLATREQIRQQADRMAADPRAKAKLLDFLHVWLKVDQAHDLAKDPKRFPGFDAAIINDLRGSLDLALLDVVTGEKSDVRQLLLGEDVYLNGRLAKFYGADLPADAPFQPVKLSGRPQAGVLTHPYMMAAFAYTGASSPVHRGVFLARGILGINLKPPQEAFSPLSEDLHPSLTTRERVALQTKGQACVTCHSVINPLGFALESFDAVGRFRAKDSGKTVDATGHYLTRTGQEVSFNGPRELAKFLAASDEVHTAFVEQLFHHLVQQPVRAYGVNVQDELRRSFAEKGFPLRALAAEIATTAAMKPRQ